MKFSILIIQEKMLDYTTKIFKGLGHPIRLKIVKELWNKRLCVCKLQENIEFSQANLSQHLKILKEAEILFSEKVGLKVMYQVKDLRILNCIELVEAIVERNIIEMKGGTKNG